MKYPKSPYFDVENHAVLVGYRGSISHGMFIPKERDGIDDKDVMGIIIPPKRFFYGMGKFEQIEEFVGEWDIVMYEIRKMFRLLVKANPNVLSLLWLDETDYIKRTSLGDRIIAARDLFVSKAAFHSFTGYAHSQLSQMTRGEFHGYMGEKRKELVQRYGYDTKNAAHLLRLLRMGREFLVEGKLFVKRKDARELLDIKMGLWSLDRVKEQAEKEFALTNEAYIHSTLPSQANNGKIDELLIEIVNEFLNGNSKEY